MRRTTTRKAGTPVSSATGVPRCSYTERLVDTGIDMTSHSGWQRLMGEIF